METKTITIGSDHAGFAMKEAVKTLLHERGYECVDEGTYSEESTDYPDYAHQVASRVEKEGGLGVLVCGSANGVAMAANKHANIRAAICWKAEIASLAREHNDANICCLPARFISEKEMEAILDAFLNADFEGGRHARRVGKIACA